MAGLELLFDGAASNVTCPADALVCLLHWELVTAGYNCRGLGEQAAESDQTSELLPKGWSDVKDVYTMRYSSKDQSLILKVIPFDNEAIINLMDTKTQHVVDLTLNLAEHIDEENLQRFERVFKNPDDTRNLVAKDLLDPMAGKGQPVKAPQQEDSHTDPLRDHRAKRNPPPHGYRPPPTQPEWSEPVNPFAVGGADLDPFGHGQGGMFMDPRHPRTPHSMFGPRPLFAGQLPPRSVPPGARFDPIGPYGIHGGIAASIAPPVLRDRHVYPEELLEAIIIYPAVKTLGGVPGTANWEETPGQTQDPLEGLYVSADLGMPWNPLGRTGGSCSGKLHLGCFAKPVAS